MRTNDASISNISLASAAKPFNTLPADQRARVARNALSVDDYSEEITVNMLAAERAMGLEHFKNQREITSNHRAILVDHLVQVHRSFRLKPETLYLAVGIVDRYLKKVETKLSQLNLVGLTCFLIASKYEEIYPPLIQEVIRSTRIQATKRDFLRMESYILKALNFQVTFPTAGWFLERYSLQLKAPQNACGVANFISELALPEASIANFKPSTIAATSLYLGLKMTGNRESWRDSLIARELLNVCVHQFETICRRFEKHPLQEVVKKYPHEAAILKSFLK